MNLISLILSMMQCSNLHMIEVMFYRVNFVLVKLSLPSFVEYVAVMLKNNFFYMVLLPTLSLLLRGGERVWSTAMELLVLAFTQGRVSVNWFEVNGQPMSL